ncbi:TcuB: works with TcuA to oxidize tricarballylate to cis-aconitate [Rhodovulum sp. P5]|uniref:FAD-dependent tricarballylate dehydrogenase TcuA n=1 Tax=Rhodovulum sp. P5 TaxID=1564506 RepID=UPI0009C2956B|nr:FAD-dependent tricarballylate dehydrogenase TcuA [Rhodovulum sp. P5]ARE39588.1 TcuB: works with TcuA to oxidize tricarballylate to cis-aconitate [Rhodovulum sp. P5]
MTLDPPPAPTKTGVLVIGGGFAGLCAAVEARLAGAVVTLLDAAPFHLRGGNARHCRNIRLANDVETAWQRGSYPVQDFLADLTRMGTPAPDLAGVLAEGSAGLGPWLAEQGVVFEPWSDGNLPWSRRTMFFRGGGQAMANALYRRAAGLGVDIRHGWQVARLEGWSGPSETGPVTVIADTPQGEWRIAALSVVLASGGYGSNRDRLVRDLGPGAAGIANRGTPFQTGTPLLWLLEHGAAAAGRPGDGHLAAVDARAPMDDAGIVSRVDGMHLGLVVDAIGRRFRDEGETVTPARYSAWGRALAARPDPRGWLILDAQALGGLPVMLYPPITADTPEDLARACGIDPAGLSATVAEVNASLNGGPPATPPRTNPDAVPLSPLTHPPFAAIPMRPGLSFTRYGLMVDTTARLRLAEGGTAPRLFAAGATMAGAVLGEGYLSGTALTIGGVFGRLAGRHAADLAGRDVRSQFARPTLPRQETPPSTPDGDPFDTARRTLNICNTCGYCTGLCDVFPAARLREALTLGDLRHLAHLCHDCRSCHYDCQYAPPHALSVNLPAALADMRVEEYRGRVLPGRAGAALTAATFTACLLLVPIATLLTVPAEVLFSAHRGAGAFYAIVPHRTMTVWAAAAFGGALGLLLLRVALFWVATAGPTTRHSRQTVLRAFRDVLTLRNLGAGGAGCEDTNGRTGTLRRWSHHLVAYGFALTFLATLSGAVLHHSAGQLAPYPVHSPPVVLGALGGVAMLMGLAGLEWRRRNADRAPAAIRMETADRVLRACLAIVAATGLALLAFREAAAMGLLLALHLGSVLGLALSLPFGKLSHGAYRAAALLRHRAERAARGLR